MRRILLAATILAFATPLVRGETPADPAPAPQAPGAASPKAKVRSKAKAGPKGAASDSTRAPGGPEQPKLDLEALVEVKQAKAAFIAAVASCERPGKCDGDVPSDREAASALELREKAFVDACSACAKPETCESERQRIRDGRGRWGYNPCAK